MIWTLQRLQTYENVTYKLVENAITLRNTTISTDYLRRGVCKSSPFLRSCGSHNVFQVQAMLGVFAKYSRRQSGCAHTLRCMTGTTSIRYHEFEDTYAWNFYAGTSLSLLLLCRSRWTYQRQRCLPISTDGGGGSAPNLTNETCMYGKAFSYMPALSLPVLFRWAAGWGFRLRRSLFLPRSRFVCPRPFTSIQIAWHVLGKAEGRSWTFLIRHTFVLFTGSPDRFLVFFFVPCALTRSTGNCGRVFI